MKDRLFGGLDRRQIIPMTALCVVGLIVAGCISVVELKSTATPIPTRRNLPTLSPPSKITTCLSLEKVNAAGILTKNDGREEVQFLLAPNIYEIDNLPMGALTLAIRGNFRPFRDYIDNEIEFLPDAFSSPTFLPEGYYSLKESAAEQALLDREISVLCIKKYNKKTSSQPAYDDFQKCEVKCNSAFWQPQK
jgi:hypothetical protein